MYRLRPSRISLLLAVLGLVGCGQAPAPPVAGNAAHPVDVFNVSPERFTHYAELPGRVEAVREAQVRARVAGIVLQRLFEEGQDVKAGELLFQIDPAPFRAALSRAQAQLAEADALLTQASASARRAASLVEIEAISKQDFDTAAAGLAVAQASRMAARADLETARLNLDHAAVRAPIAGRIGRAAVTEGALVGQDDATLMATIQQLDPVHVDFIQAAADTLRAPRQVVDASSGASDEGALALILGHQVYPQRGTLLFTGASVDRSTGQVPLRARFANPRGALLPGMYVRVRIAQFADSDTIFVPQRAIQRNAAGQARVLIARADNTAEQRAVETGIMQGSRWQITHGLRSGDRVVVSPVGAIKPDDLLAVQPADAAINTQ